VKKLIGLLVTMSVVVAVFCVTVTGQQSCKVPFHAAYYSLYYLVLYPPTPLGANNCLPDGPWSVECQVQSWVCPPHPDKVCPFCPDSGSPIALSTGNTYIEQTDARLPGLARGLELTRVWNSRTGVAQGLFGRGWRSNYEEAIFVDSEGYVDYWRGDGSIWSFGFYGLDPAGSGYSVYWLAAPANRGATFQTGATYWTVTFKDGEKRLFDIASGRLTSIVDRNGNTTQLTYDNLNRLSVVTDPAARHLYFNYGVSGNLVQTVTTDFGISLTYTYDGQQRLTQVTYPDSTFKTFEFDANSFVTAVKDSQGKVLESHTYNTCGQGLTSSRAGGVEALSVTYPLGCGLELP